MNNPYRGGTADFWYSGCKADLWVEYKWLPRIPKSEYSLTCGKKPSLSVLQQKWLLDRHNEGRHVCVIIGVPSGVIILNNLTWLGAIDFNKIISRDTAAAWIIKETMNAVHKPTISNRKGNSVDLQIDSDVSTYNSSSRSRKKK